MTNSRLPRTPNIICALALLAMPAPAFADLSAQDVWEAFSKQLSAYGEMQSDVTQSGGTLTARAITLSTDVEGLRSETALSGAISFQENTDGTVSILFPTEMSAKLTVSGAAAAAPTTVTYSFSQQGMEVTASGEPGNISHEFSAPQLSYVLNGMSVNGKSMGGTLQLDLTNTVGSWLSTGQSVTEIIADYTIDAMLVNANFTDPATQDEIKFTAQVEELAAQSENTIPDGLQSMTPQAMFASGFGVAAQLDYGAVSYGADVTSKGQNTKVLGSIEQGNLNVAVNGDQVRYATTFKQVDVSGGVAGLPLPPVEIHLDSSSFNLLMPLAKTDAARDFGLAISLEGFTVSDFIWAMLDPAQQLPRDAANVVLALKGTGNWLVNIFDTDALENSTAVPGKVESLSLEALKVTIAGASLTGDGAFTFDNGDLATFGGVPRPEGTLNLALKGGITLLDKLTAMNIVPQQQAFGIKAMSGLFARPGPGPDELISRIEIDPTGRVLANGQPIR